MSTDYVIYNMLLYIMGLCLFGIFGDYTIEREWTWAILYGWGVITGFTAVITLANEINNWRVGG